MVHVAFDWGERRGRGIPSDTGLLSKKDVQYAIGVLHTKSYAQLLSQPD